MHRSLKLARLCPRSLLPLLRNFSEKSDVPVSVQPSLTYSEPTDIFDGYTRSRYIKRKFVDVSYTAEDGSLRVRRVATGLIDNSNEWLGDQMTRIHMKITHDYDLTLEGFAERSRKRLIARHKKRQLITDEIVQKRGSLDLAVAHMVCALGGRVQFVGGPPDHWHQCYNKSPPDLPLSYSGELKLEAVDFSGTAVMYEGLLHLPELTHLRMLRLRRCLHLNDHGLSLVGQITQSPLEYLDISECPKITANGITALTELKSLKRLLVQGNPTLEDRELVCLLLEDYLPEVYIEGVDYLGNLPEDAKQRVLALVPPEELPRLTEKKEEESFKDNLTCVSLS
ncbi:unnamed protein product [Hymenolepis diminuta]|uniref:ATP synthase subunit s, mitochondrial n=1 Tax=Hymenolepis diminuta TaxID=6216 RepID=A0A0R3SCH4_HYMDI|nr:unnamed protein product [Hymenolepis diminuta]VUZ55812.1 unnamed protein product [Hymenolepis diminuta]